MKLKLSFPQLLFSLSSLLLIVSIISLGIGTVWISPDHVLYAILGMGEQQDWIIIKNFRIPRIIVAILVGSGLAVSGAILQGVIRNPLASPDVIGITKGASLAAAIVILLFPHASVMWLPIAAFLGALAVVLLLYLFAFRKGAKPSTLALSGIAIGAICDSVLQYFMVKFPIQINAALTWLTGSLWSKSMDDVLLLLPWLIVLVPLTIILAIKLDVMQLGEELATGLGEKVTELRILFVIIAVILAGACVAIVGALGFVGLIAPHIAKRIVGGRHPAVIPTTAIIGALIVVLADTVGRGIASPMQVPAGIITAIIGVPYFLYLLKRWR